ncbi:MAG: Txe/YoeB family addiction module toxin [Bacteroidaceae bacterium]|nr:Txe/YoeB family addiction module toxin [Bacteroidaceae bacterium]
MTYKVDFDKRARIDLNKLYKSEPTAYKKALRLIEELYEHPRTGTGHPEQLKGDLAGLWSRTITKKHRLVYEIQEEVVLVLVLTAYGHYDDK